jgi:hypothetical protein
LTDSIYKVYYVFNRRNSLILNEEEKKTFSKKVENIVKERGGTYLEAVIELCEKHEIEPGIVAKSLSKPIVEKLKIEGQDLNILPKQEVKLPI